MLFLKMPWWREAIRGIMSWLCQSIYSIMSFFYDLFVNLSQIDILSTSDVKPIYERITMILTIVMIFYITFQFVKYIVEPNAMTDKEKGAGNILYKMIIVIVLIAFVPKIFEFANYMQKAIINKNVISKVILGPQAITNEENLGASFSASVFNMFYYVNAENSDKNCHDGATCGQIVNKNISSLKTDGDLSSLSVGINEVDKSDEPLIHFEFDGLLPTIVGGFIVYILILYCIDVGVRWVQLLYLQLIAPIPILGYLTPKKDGIFQKWTKQCITTYLDLFLRVAIINLMLLLCDTLLKSKISGDLVPAGSSFMMSTLIYVVLIMAVMLFAHKAPKMLAELFPKQGAAAGNFGLTAKDRFATPMNYAKLGGRVGGALAGTAIGAVLGAGSGLAQGFRRRNRLNKDGTKKGIGAGALGAAQGFAGGLVGGATRGLINGSKKGNVIKNSLAGAKKQTQANQRFGNRQENGYGLIDQIEDRARARFDAKSRAEVQEAKKAPIKRHNEYLKKVEDTRSKIEKRAIDKINEGGKGGAAAQNYLGAQRRLKELQENQEVREKEFKVAKFTNNKTAQAAYDADVTLAKASINKANYINPTTGEFINEEAKKAYDKAVEAAVSKINASDYSVAYKTDAEAQAAYQAAVKEKTDKVDRNQYATEEDYNKALQEAASTVNAEIYTKGYATEKEAQEALGAEIQKQLGIVDKAKDAAVAEYVAIVDDEGKPKDGAIVQWLTELQAEIKEYNATATTNDIVPVKDENGKIVNESINRHIDLASSEDIMKHFDVFTDEVKGGKINTAKNKNATRLIEIDAEIDRIKQQTAGSGINEGKK